MLFDGYTKRIEGEYVIGTYACDHTRCDKENERLVRVSSGCEGISTKRERVRINVANRLL